MDVLITVRGKASCMIVCDPVDVTCAIIQDATIAKIRECLGDRLSEVCEGGGPCAPLNYSLRDTDGNILLSGIEQNPCGNELPLIAPNGTVTRDGLPFGSVLSGGTLDVPSDCPPCDPLTITINEEEAALIEDPCGDTVPFIVVDRNSIVVPVTLNRGTIVVDDLPCPPPEPCPPTTVNGVESETPTITVIDGNDEPVGTLDPETGIVTVPACPPPETLCGLITAATSEEVVTCIISSGKRDAVRCDLLGDVEAADVQAQILDCVTTPAREAIRVILSPLKFALAAFTDTSITFTVTADEAGTYGTYTQDGGSGTLTYSLNGGAFVALSGSIVLAIGNTIAVRRTNTAAAGFIRWAQ
jgi:hypothetical protein